MSSWSSWSSWANDSFVESAWSNKNSALMLLYSARTLTDVRPNQNFQLELGFGYSQLEIYLWEVWKDKSKYLGPDS